jgi:hypothetical protein
MLWGWSSFAVTPPTYQWAEEEMTNGDKEPKLGILPSLRERMKSQLYVPSISTIALCVAAAGLIVAILNGSAQRERWRIEDDARDPHPQANWSHELVQGKYRTLGLWTVNPLSNPIRLISIEIISPKGATVSAYADYQTRIISQASGAQTALNRQILGNSFDNTLYLALRVPNTPNDQGEFIELVVKYEETTYPPRLFSKVVRNYIPAAAAKQ